MLGPKLTRPTMAHPTSRDEVALQLDTNLPANIDWLTNYPHLTRLLDVLPGMVFVGGVDSGWSMKYLSQGCLSITGYSSEELVRFDGAGYNAITHPEDLAPLLAAIATAVAQRQSYELEYRIRTKTGQQKWLWEKGRGVFDHNQQLLRIEGFITDITPLKQAEANLKHRVEFEKLLTGLATHFINLPSDQIDQGINMVLREIGQFSGADRSYIFRFHPDLQVMDNTHEWCAEGIQPQIKSLQGVQVTALPCFAAAIIGLETIHFPCVTDLPEGPRKQNLQRQGVQSLIEVPMVSGGQLLGYLGLEHINSQVAWPEEVISLLQVVAEVFVNALERQQSEAQLLRTSSELQGIFLALPDLYFRLDRQTTILDFKAGDCSDLYAPPQEFLGKRMVEILPPAVAEQFQRAIVELTQGKQRLDIEYSLPMSQGVQFYEARLLSFLDQEVLVVIRNISERKYAEQELRDAEEKYRGIFENATEGIFQSSPSGRYLNVNPALAKLYGYDSPEELQTHLTDITQQLYVIPQRRQEFVELLQHQGSVTGFESQVYRKDQQVIWISENARAVKDAEGNILYFEGTVADITARKQAEITIRYQAFHDLLTGLPNRSLLDDRLSQALAQSHRNGEMVAVMFMDLDRFKTINDTLGHAIGDQLLQQVVERIINSLRDVDTIARWGGDEFTILLPHLSYGEDIIQVAERILSALKPAFTLEGQSLHITCSLGIAVYPYDGEDSHTLLRNADAALYQAKKQGRNRYRLYTSTLNSQASELLTLENELHKALENQELRVYYQPQINSHTGKIVQVEALVRWQHPQLGLVSPQTFIGLAEENGLIVAIGEWVLHTACQQCLDWQSQGFTDLSVSVNLSARQFQQPNLVAAIAKILAETGLAPTYLELEITESTAMNDVEFSRSLLHKLRKMGVGISLDDFGTGYSSLGYLKRFPLNALKIDRTFIRDLPSDPQDLAITTAVIALGKGLNLSVVAEGVETEAQFQILKSLHCEAMQGYLFSPPIPAPDLTALLTSQS